MADATPGQLEAIEILFKDRRLAHKDIFAHRHKYATPEFHWTIIDDLHSDDPALCEIAFRDAAKSTLAEEAICLRAGFKEFKHCMIVGCTLEKAQERLHAIRRQFEKNERFRTVFGDLVGRPWGSDSIETSTGITIQAIGRQQAIRGTKNEDTRPDFILVDDLEDEESVRTPEGRRKTQTWFHGELLPAGDGANLKVVVLCNDMHVESLGNTLDRPGSGFKVRRFPWEYIGEDGERRASWPARFPLSYVEKTRDRYFSNGRAAEYNSNYMCRSESPDGKPFKTDMFRYVPRVHNWQATYAFYDPARTVKKTSATTGKAVWSWIGPKLVVWEADGQRQLPNEIIDDIFSVNARYRPVEIGAEPDGLEEWMMQPIRQEQVKRGIMLPIRGIRAPKGKIDFIKGLQVFFNAREVEFAGDFPELKAQLLSFPSGAIDVPNALAYALTMRPGAPFYEDFTVQNIAEGIEPAHGPQLWCILNADGRLVTASLAQFVDGCLRVFRDWVREGLPSEVLPNLMPEISMEAGRNFKLVAPPIHWDKFNNVGLNQALKRMQREIRQGSALAAGRAEIRTYLQRQVRGFPALMVSTEAAWTLNGFSGGYCRAIEKHGAVADYAQEGIYRVLLEGLESFGGMLKMGSSDEETSGINYQTSRDGRRFISARVQR